MTNKKGTCNGKSNGNCKDRQQIPLLRCGMTNKKGECNGKNNGNCKDKSRFLRCAAE